MLVASFSLAFVQVAQAETEQSFSRDLDWICGTSKIDNRAYLLKYGNMEPDTGNPWTIMVDDDYLGIEYAQDFELVYEGEHGRIWIGLNDSITLTNATVVADYEDAEGNFHFFYPWSDTGTSWLWQGYHDIISRENLTYILEQFDEVIYPTDTTYFGMPNERPAGNTKIDILIFNIRDEIFWSPETAEFYIAGYFSSAVSQLNDANIIHIDTYELTWRLGPNPPLGGPAYRPYLYEGVVAHEFQHLIHFDIDSDEDDWINEGCSDFAGFLCGYGHPQDHIVNYLAYHPFTSLTFWGGGLEDYGASYLFTLYLSEHYGGANFISQLVQNPLNGIEGIEDTLDSLGYAITFDTVFHNWAIANYIDDTSLGNGKYGYFSLDIPSTDTWGYSIQYFLWNWWIGMEFNRGFSWQASLWPGTVQPYTVNYWEFWFTPAGKKVNFLYEGDAISGQSAYSGDYHWYGGMGNWAWRKLGQTFSIPIGGATLMFYTFYEIEQDWDYAYVEVYDKTVDEWTTLEGLETTSTLPHEQDNPNTPDGREPKDYYSAGKWYALTGFSPGYYQEEMDLTAFAGHDIDLYFVYWTDGAYNEQGIYIDDIEIPEIGFFDDVEPGEDGWTSEGWTRTTGLEPNNWLGAVIDVTGIQPYRNPSVRYNIRTGKMINFQPGMLHNVWDFSGGSLTIPKKYVNTGHVFVAVFWNAAPHILRGDYWFCAY